MHPMLWPLILAAGGVVEAHQENSRPDLPDRDASDEEWKAYKARMDEWRTEQDRREEERRSAQWRYRDQRGYEHEFRAALDAGFLPAKDQASTDRLRKAAEKRERIRLRNLARAAKVSP